MSPITPRRLSHRTATLVLLASSAPACSLLVDWDQFTSNDAGAVDAGPPEDSKRDDDVSGDSGSDAGDASDDGDGGPPSYRDVVLADAPIAYYRLGETQGEIATDATGVGPLGQYIGVSFAALGALANDPDTAIKLVPEAPPSAVNLGDNFMFTGTAPFSIELWIKSAAEDTRYNFVVCKETGSPRTGYAMHYRGDAGVTLERFSNDEARSVTGRVLQPGLFAHVVGTYDGTYLRIFVDGLPAGKATTDTRELANYPARAVIGSSSAYSSTANGVVDEVAFYDKALSIDQVAAHFAAASR